MPTPHDSGHLQAAAEVEDFVQEMKRCYRLPYGEKPDMQQWQSSPHAHRIMAIQGFALDTANPEDLALAIQMVQVSLKQSINLSRLYDDSEYFISMHLSYPGWTFHFSVIATIDHCKDLLLALANATVL